MTKSKSWREILPVHPAADLFPSMSEAELRELGEDIKKNGLQIPIVLWVREGQHKDRKRYSLLDGRNRLDAMELVGIPFELSMGEYCLWNFKCAHATTIGTWATPTNSSSAPTSTGGISPLS
jgi:hypothetical protein